MTPFRRAAAVAVAVLLLLATGCTRPSELDVADWRSTAQQSLESAASEVATVRLVLQQQEKGQLVGRTAIVAATYSEEAMGSAQDSILTQQPPKGIRAEYDDVSSVLGDAGDLVTEARVALVDQDEEDYAPLAERLQKMQKRLDEVRSSLGRAR